MFPLGPLLNHNVAAMGAPTGGAWTPLSLGSGLAAWYDADQQSESANAAVATFVDRSGNSKDFTQATGGSQPLLRFAAINGKKVLDFDGVDDSMTCTAGLMNGATAGAWFAVIVLDADPPVNLGSTGGALLTGFSSGSFDNHHPFTDGSIYDGFGATARNSCGNPTPSLASTALIGSISGAGDFRFLVNNTTLFSTGTNTVGFGTGTRIMGNSPAAVLYFGGLVAEIIMVNYVPSAGDISNIVSYVNTKFGTAF